MTDPISDMLSRIRNAHLAKKKEVVLPYSNLKMELLKIFHKEGYISDVEKKDSKFGEIKIVLKYIDKQPAIRSIKRVSRPSRRVYGAYDKLPVVLNGMGISVISTSKGLMTNKEAKRQKIGGEIMCEIY